MALQSYMRLFMMTVWYALRSLRTMPHNQFLPVLITCQRSLRLSSILTDKSLPCQYFSPAYISSSSQGHTQSAACINSAVFCTPLSPAGRVTLYDKCGTVCYEVLTSADKSDGSCGEETGWDTEEGYTDAASPRTGELSNVCAGVIDAVIPSPFGIWKSASATCIAE